MSDTYLDTEGRECARHTWGPCGWYRYWRRWVVMEDGAEWYAHTLDRAKDMSTRTLGEMRRKLVEEDTK